MTQPQYLHGFDGPEQQRLIAQARFWKDELILAGTRYQAGQSLLEIGCGVGAVLGVLGQAFPGLQLHGVDREPRQIEVARDYLASLGLSAELTLADALALPLADSLFDQAWMMWFLEHVPDPVQALKEARRVLKPGGQLTAIEVDYSLLRVESADADLQALLHGYEQGMRRSGCADAGTRMGAWMQSAGFSKVDVRPQDFDWQGPDLPRRVDYLLGFMEGSIPGMLGLPGVAEEATLRRGGDAFRRLARSPQGRVRLTVHKAWATQ